MKMTIDTPELLNLLMIDIKVFSNLIGVSERTIFEWQKNGKCPSSVEINGISRWFYKEVAEWLSSLPKTVDKKNKAETKNE